MTTKNSKPESAVSRRDFLFMSTTALAGMFGAGSLAWGSNRHQAALEAESYAAFVAQMGSNTGAVDTGNSLATAEAQIARLAAELGQSQQQATDALTRLNQTQLALEAAQAELADLRSQVAANADRNSVMAGLLGLYEGLEGVGLDLIVRMGLGILAAAWGSLRALGDVLGVGLNAADGVLTSFDATLTTLRENLMRLLPTTDALTVQVARVEQETISATDNTSGRASSPLAAVTEFVAMILKNLPFGFGARVEQGLTMIRDVMAQLPQTLSNMRSLILQPMSNYLAETTDGWQQSVVRGLRNNVLGPAKALLTSMDDTDQRLRAEFIDPTNVALAERGRLREEISAYKETHAL